MLNYTLNKDVVDAKIATTSIKERDEPTRNMKGVKQLKHKL